MSGASLAAASAAAALLYYARKGPVCGGAAGDSQEFETHRDVHRAPQTWAENLFFFAEGLRYTYSETLGRWRTADLLIGLAYLSRKDDGTEHAAADIAQQAAPLGHGQSLEQLDAALAEVEFIERFMRYCFVMRERKMQAQRDMFGSLGIGEEDILMHEMHAGVLKPSFVLVRDTRLRCVVLSIRGTHSFKDMFTSLTGASKPHHLVDANGVVLGYSHFGMLAAARWIKSQTVGRLEAALAANPGYALKIIGHSLGGGTAALLTMMLREQGGPFAAVTCLAIACPSCMTLELARSCGDYVTTVVNGADVIPTVSPGAADLLREEVMRSSWFLEFRRDVRSSSVVRAVESGLRGVGSATWSATTWTSAKLSACYPRRRASVPGRTLKRRNSDDWSGQEVQAGGVGIAYAAEEAQLLQGAGAAGRATLSAMHSATSASLLGMLSSSAPAGAGGTGSSVTQHMQQHAQQQQEQQQGGQGGVVWGRRFVGWSQQVGALTGRGAYALGSGLSSGSRLAVRGTSGLLARVWSQSCGLPAACGGVEPALPGGEDEGGDAGDGGAGQVPPSSPPSDVLMDGSRRGDDEEEDEGDALEDAADSEALAAELSLRMSAVEAAVGDAEEEERQRGEASDCTVPSVIRPGSYGNGSPSPSRHLFLSSPSKQDPQWRRAMFPAGRILHLVPAALLEAASNLDSASSRGSGDYSPSCSSSSRDLCSPPRPAPPGPLPASPTTPRDHGQQQQENQQQQQWRLPEESRRAHARRASTCSLQDMMAGEDEPLAGGYGGSPCGGEEEGAWVRVGSPGGEDGPEEGGSNTATAGPALHADCVLLDWVPQQAYGRIKLCRRMLADHFIPSYLAALGGAQRALQRQRALLALQEAQQEGGREAAMCMKA